MMDPKNTYRKRECKLCKKVKFEKYLGREKSLDGGFTPVDRWEISDFGALVIASVDFPQEYKKGNERIEIEICLSCKNKIFNAIESEIETIKRGIEK